MQTYQISSFLAIEGGRWQPLIPNIETTVADLETAMQKRFRTTNGTRVTKIPQLPMPFHALMTYNGKIWDCENGWR